MGIGDTRPGEATDGSAAATAAPVVTVGDHDPGGGGPVAIRTGAGRGTDPRRHTGGPISAGATATAADAGGGHGSRRPPPWRRLRSARRGQLRWHRLRLLLRLRLLRRPQPHLAPSPRPRPRRPWTPRLTPPTPAGRPPPRWHQPRCGRAECGRARSSQARCSRGPSRPGLSSRGQSSRASVQPGVSPAGGGQADRGQGSARGPGEDGAGSGRQPGRPGVRAVRRGQRSQPQVLPAMWRLVAAGDGIHPAVVPALVAKTDHPQDPRRRRSAPQAAAGPSAAPDLAGSPAAS